MKVLLSFILTLCIPTLLHAQKENNIWIVGDNLGIDFNQTPPATFKTQPIFGTAGPATASDKNGDLRFYTNGRRIWDRNNNLMPNGIIDEKSASGGQQSQIIPFINDTNRYYLLTFHDSAYTIKYSVIDMSLNNGNGEVILKGIWLDDHMARKLVAIKGSGCFTWLLTHKLGSNEFKAYKITEQGIEPPISSFSGTFSDYYSYYVGNLAVSKDCSKIALASEMDYGAELYDFDNTTGVVSNARVIAQYDMIGRAHSVCFSPDGTKLYLTGGSHGSELIQFDISDPSIPGITIVDTGSINGQLRLGPDSKMYTSTWFGVYCIPYPNKSGQDCGFDPHYIVLKDSINVNPYSLGVDIIFPDQLRTSNNNSYRICKGDSIEIVVPGGYNLYIWNDNDTTSKRVIKTDTFILLSSFGACSSRVDSFKVDVIGCNCKVFVPNAFTPNNDGKNDQLRALGVDMEYAEMKVFNRWGQLVFSTDDRSDGWDGRFNGMDCEVGTYYYFLKTKCLKGQTVQQKGEVTLIR